MWHSGGTSLFALRDFDGVCIVPNKLKMRSICRYTAFLLLATLSSLAAFAALRITILNPAWRIHRFFPDAEVSLETINSPDFYFWPWAAEHFGITMPDPDHSLTVTFENRTDRINFTLLVGADCVSLNRCRITDISDLLRCDQSFRQLVTFYKCDFSGLTPTQRTHLRPGDQADIFYAQ
jgi:hypothetical protein